MKATAAGWLAFLAIACAGALCDADSNESQHLAPLAVDVDGFRSSGFLPSIDAPGTPPRPASRVQRPTTSKRARPDEIVTIIIPATAPWTDTGISVSAGDGLEIRTWGTVTFGDAGSASATPKGSGLQGGGCKFVVIDSKVAAHSVIGNIAPHVSFDGRGFFVGPVWKATVPVQGSTAPEGHLVLGFNDGAMMCDRSGYDSWDFSANNRGSFTAEIAITRAR